MSANFIQWLKICWCINIWVIIFRCCKKPVLEWGVTLLSKDLDGGTEWWPSILVPPACIASRKFQHQDRYTPYGTQWMPFKHHMSHQWQPGLGISELQKCMREKCPFLKKTRKIHIYMHSFVFQNYTVWIEWPVNISFKNAFYN